jgi:hypothetical protein
MDKIEKYIVEHRHEFDYEAAPSGSRERFMAAAQAQAQAQQRRRRTRVLSLSFAGLAAACTVVFMVPFSQSDLSRELERQHRRLAEKESEIMILADKEFPQEKEMIINTIRAILVEAIPLEEQLPEEISMKEKSQILKSYYDRKYAALENLMTQYIETL